MPNFVEPRVRKLFCEVLERPEAEREALLARECGADARLRAQVLDLLAAHAGAAGRLVESHDQVGEQPGDRIGRFKLLQKIGEGGFGTVWMAEQEEPVRRRVALKVLKAGMDTAQVVGRFEGERQALALMDHPNIAKVHDGGATPQGRPYFVMELVKGVPITKYCDEAGLGMAQRLELFVSVCQAVQHAHQKGVIHRDLKPSNVLVTLHDGKPVAKVIDFGIAKATQGSLAERTVFTEFRQMLGTPEYMAPEQAELSGLDIDTRADVYSLGVLLYELLTGTRPFEIKDLLQAGLAEIVRTIKEVDPPKPSTRVSTLGAELPGRARQRCVSPRGLGALIRGDLDWIVMKALEKERGRRYDTAVALAEDVRRHLRHEPVLAGPPRRLYRLRKYVRRHRVGVAASAAILCALVGGTAAAGWGYFAAREQARLAGVSEQNAVAARQEERRQKEAALLAQGEARREAAKATQVVDLLSGMLASGDPHQGKGRDYPARLVLADFERTLPGKLQAEPEVEAELRGVLGECYLGLGMPEAAEPHLQKALELWRAAAAASPTQPKPAREVALALRNVARLRHDQGRYEQALALNHEAEAALPPHVSDEDRDELRSFLLEQAGDLLWHMGRLAEAEAAVDAAQALHISSGNTPLRTACILELKASIAAARGDLASAEQGWRRVLELQRSMHGEEHPVIAHCLNGLANVLSALDRTPEAAELYRQALELNRKLFGNESRDVASNLHNLALIHERLGDLQAAEDLQREAIAIDQKVRGPDHPDHATALGNLALLVLARGRIAEAERLARQAVELTEKQGGSGALLGGRLANLASILRDDWLAGGADRLAEAEELARRAVALLTAHAERHPDTAIGLKILAGILCQRGKLDEAEQMHQKVLALLRETLHEDHPSIAGALHDLGLVLHARGRLPEAETALRDALAKQQSCWGKEHREVATCRQHLAAVLAARGARAEAEALYRAALAIHRTGRSEEHDLVGRCANELGHLLMAGNRFAEAEQAYREAHERMRMGVGPEHRNFATAMHNLGVALGRQGKLAEAKELLEPALALRERLLGADAPDTLKSIDELAHAYRVAGDHATAASLFRRALETRRRTLGETHAETGKSLVWLASTLRHAGQLPEAERVARESLAWNGQKHGQDSTQAAGSLATLAWIHLQLGRPAEAESLARRSLAIRSTKLPGTRQHYASMALLGRALAGQERWDEAEAPLLEACEKLQPDWITGTELLREALACLLGVLERKGGALQAERWRERLKELEGRGR